MRLHLVVPNELAEEIDEFAGSQGRDGYIREAIEAKLEVDRRVAARRQLVGSFPDFAAWMTPEWISENREREGRERDRPEP